MFIGKKVFRDYASNIEFIYVLVLNLEFKYKNIFSVNVR